MPIKIFEYSKIAEVIYFFKLLKAKIFKRYDNYINKICWNITLNVIKPQ